MRTGPANLFSIVLLAVSVLIVPTQQLTVDPNVLRAREEANISVFRNDTRHVYAYAKYLPFDVFQLIKTRSSCFRSSNVAAASVFTQDLDVRNGYWLGGIILGSGQHVDGEPYLDSSSWCT